jgi:site-specific recombinase XerD
MNTKTTTDIATRAATELAAATELVDLWLAYERDTNQASDNTLAAYRKGLDVFASWLQDAGTGEVTAADVWRFRDALQARRHAVQTVNLRLTAVRRFYSFLVNTNRVPVNPAAEVKGLKRVKSRTTHKRDALTNAEVKAVIDTCDPTKVDGIRDWAILSLMAYCALRTVECHRADIGDLRTRQDRLTLDVQGKGRVEKDEFVVIPPAAERAIRMWLGYRTSVRFADHDADAPLFVSLSNQTHGDRLGLRAICGMVKARYQDAGVVGKKSTHSLRHSAITNVIRHGGSVLQAQALARHADINTTMGYYHEMGRLDNPAEDLISYDNDGGH